MLKIFLLSMTMLILLVGLSYPQTEKKIPQYLLDQLEIAQENEYIEEENRIMNIINTKYSDGVFCEPIPESSGEEVIEGENNPHYTPDWMGSDILVWSGSTDNITHKTLDLKMCEDGNMYLAVCTNQLLWRGIRVYRSINSGLNWEPVGYRHWTSTYYITSLSMLVERNHPSNNDSIRVIIFYTRSHSTDNSNAVLEFWSFKPNVAGGSIANYISMPISGYQFRCPSAVSNGMFQSTSTDIGVVVGVYNNALTDCDNLRYYYMSNFSWNFIEYVYNDPNEDFWPSAAYKDINGTDSVFVAVERRFTTDSRIRILTLRFISPGTTWPFIEVTNPVSGNYYRMPTISIPQNKFSCDRMVITYTQNATSSATTGRGRLSYSYNGGASWTQRYLGNSYTTRYTSVSSDSNGTSGYCTFIWGDSDSLNVRRGTAAFSGATYFDRASHNLTGSAFPVCAVYNNSSGNHRRSAFAYWKSGPADIYFDAENLPTGITNTNGIANTYSLSQNFPNPFNPTTTINFSIPKDGLVKLVVFDVLGKEVATLVNGEQTAGNYQVTFDASKLTSGVYFYKIISGDFSEVKKMLLIK